MQILSFLSVALVKQHAKFRRRWQSMPAVAANHNPCSIGRECEGTLALASRATLISRKQRPLLPFSSSNDRGDQTLERPVEILLNGHRSGTSPPLIRMCQTPQVIHSRVVMVNGRQGIRHEYGQISVEAWQQGAESRAKLWRSGHTCSDCRAIVIKALPNGQYAINSRAAAQAALLPS